MSDLTIREGSVYRKNKAFGLRHGIPSFPKPEKLKQQCEDVWKAENVHQWDHNGGCLMALQGQLIKAQDEIESEIENVGALSSAYVAAIKKIRGELGNDVESIAKASLRLKAETVKAIDQYRAALDLWTSPEMQMAISNAERLAAALQSVNELKSQSITFAVLDKKAAA